MNYRRILITGGTGLLGKSLLEAAPEGWEVHATYHAHQPPVAWTERFHPLDIRDDAAVERLVAGLRPQVVIHTASIGSVDDAEREPERIARVNVGGTQAVGRACAHTGAQLVFISSNAVFDGSQPPYREDAPLRAVNHYGALKIAAEAWVRETLSTSVIIRPILMYGWPLPGGRGNVVTRWLDQLERGETVQAADDLYSKPLLADSCAQAVWAAVRQRGSGTYHLAGADRVSLAAFAQEAARIFGYDEGRIEPVLSARMTQFAPRPRDTSFATEKMERELGVRPIGVREGLSILQRTRVAAG